MATRIRAFIRRPTGRPDPAPSGLGPRIQTLEQQAARRRLLESNQAQERRWTP
ncbi:hypothetical protein [Micromonospora sp. WMMA1996]|uniref:hypothetical protein n=1 Tax=Micromonospora sp. WMMA1996 TaxID=2039878 RepID=UPI00159BD33B|nr:hypothetical protein [Micromonospora sp. WMMA1996]